MSTLRAAAAIILALAFWLVIYRLAQLVVYGVPADMLTWLLNRPAAAPDMKEKRWLDILLLLGSFAAAAYVAYLATRSGESLERDAKAQ